jgi:hypothetical protein
MSGIPRLRPRLCGGAICRDGPIGDISTAANSTHFHGILVPVEERSTTSLADIAVSPRYIRITPYSNVGPAGLRVGGAIKLPSDRQTSVIRGKPNDDENTAARRV